MRELFPFGIVTMLPQSFVMLIVCTMFALEGEREIINYGRVQL